MLRPSTRVSIAHLKRLLKQTRLQIGICRSFTLAHPSTVQIANSRSKRERAEFTSQFPSCDHKISLQFSYPLLTRAVSMSSSLDSKSESVSSDTSLAEAADKAKSARNSAEEKKDTMVETGDDLFGDDHNHSKLP